MSTQRRGFLISLLTLCIGPFIAARDSLPVSSRLSFSRDGVTWVELEEGETFAFGDTLFCRRSP